MKQTLFFVLFAVFVSSTVAQTTRPMPQDDIHSKLRNDPHAGLMMDDPHAGHNHPPGMHPGEETVLKTDPVKDAAFIEALDLDTLKTLSIQHNQTLKTLDSFARQTITTISGKRTFAGQPSVYTVLDMAFRPEVYRDQNLIKIKNVPLRQDFQLLEHLSVSEKDRILKQGTITLRLFLDPRVQNLLGEQQAAATFKMQAIGQLQEAAGWLMLLSDPDLPEFKFFPPATSNPDDHVWRSPKEMMGTVPQIAELIRKSGQSPPPALAGYESARPLVQQAIDAIVSLRRAWIDRDAVEANKQIATLAGVLPQVNPGVYPSPMKRNAEVVYNKLAQLTIPGIMFYFTAMVLFLLSARSGWVKLRLWGLRFMVIGFLVHTAGIGIRWWLVEKSVGNWFESIPIKNMFESVMFSAWFGALIALILEIRRSRGLFGAAGSFVGTLSLVALLTVPYVFRDIGGEISQSAGVLMSYWLYIHVTLVVASYALIGMGFLLSIWWLIEYYRQAASRPNVGTGSGGAMGFDPVIPGEPQGGAMALSATQTLASMLFLKKPVDVLPAENVATEERSTQFLISLDACNLVVLQLAFWVLGVGIILGAIWADMSWGRPWAWDPKETFALVTWIVYLIVVHVRVATVHKAWWTAVLSIIGFFVMLFNWIGVNFFLVGLHSYA